MTAPADRVLAGGQLHFFNVECALQVFTKMSEGCRRGSSRPARALDGSVRCSEGWWGRGAQVYVLRVFDAVLSDRDFTRSPAGTEVLFLPFRLRSGAAELLTAVDHSGTATPL